MSLINFFFLLWLCLCVKNGNQSIYFQFILATQQQWLRAFSTVDTQLTFDVWCCLFWSFDIHSNGRLNKSNFTSSFSLSKCICIEFKWSQKWKAHLNNFFFFEITKRNSILTNERVRENKTLNCNFYSLIDHLTGGWICMTLDL